MARKTPKNPVLAAIRRASQDEAAAVAFIESLRWGSEPACPRCGDSDVYPMQDRKTGEREKHYRWRCRGCGKMFSVRTGTVFEETRLPLRIWCHAFWRSCASKKGVSALQIARECEITHKSALFMLHRIRLAQECGPDAPKLRGTVEADETYIGGKPRYRQGQRAKGTFKPKFGRATDKAPVFAVVERGGNVRASTITTVNKDNLGGNIRRYVDMKNSRLITDEERSYIQLAPEFGGGHDTVNHSKREYVRGDVYTNTAEGFFSLMKRAIYGTYHSVSKHHLPRYVTECEFRYNTRKLDDGARTVAAIRGAEGKRLLYRQPAEAHS